MWKRFTTVALIIIIGLVASSSGAQELITVDMGTSSLNADEYYFTLWAKRGVSEKLPGIRIKMGKDGNIISKEESFECRFGAYKPVNRTSEAWVEHCDGLSTAVVHRGQRYGALNRGPGEYIDGHDFFIDGNNNVYTIITNPKVPGEPYGFSIQKQTADHQLLFDWHSDEHMSPSEAYIPMFRDGDWAHVNSIDVLDPYIIVSLRHTNSVVAIDERDGTIAWRLGGALNDFSPIRGTHTNFSCMQHTARFVSPTKISVYDNGNHCRDISRGVVYELNFTDMTFEQIVSVSDNIYGPSGGGFQSRLDSHVVAWGHTRRDHTNFATEFNSDGIVRFYTSNPDLFNYQMNRRYYTEDGLYLPLVLR